MTMQDDHFKYLAFISYSRADNMEEGQRWATWIKESVENFPIFEVSKEIFLDTKVLVAAEDLDNALKTNLEASRFLILICSPNSVKSEFVNAEINHFKQSRGVENIIPVVISGKETAIGSEDGWKPMAFPEVIGRTFADFRAESKADDGSKVLTKGWTLPSYYEKHIRGSGRRYIKREIKTLVSSYNRRYADARFAMLAKVFDKNKVVLERIEAETNHPRLLRKLILQIAVAGFVALAFLAIASVAYQSYGRARTEQAKAERGLFLIGDAHEQANRAIADILVNLGTKVPLAEREAAMASARNRINDYLDGSALSGDGNDSIHMRAVIADSRGLISRKQGNLEEARKHYDESLELREKLIARERSNEIYLHNLSVSYDNLGDCHAAKAVSSANDQATTEAEWKEAISFYRKSLETSRTLANTTPSNRRWQHDLAVGYFKLGNALYLSDRDSDRDEALEKLGTGMIKAEQLADSDPDYPKWQAHFGLFCLELGRIHALAAEDDQARAYLNRGRSTLIKLRDHKLMAPQYTEWLNQIEEILKSLPDSSP